MSRPYCSAVFRWILAGLLGPAANLLLPRDAVAAQTVTYIYDVSNLNSIQQVGSQFGVTPPADVVSSVYDSVNQQIDFISYVNTSAEVTAYDAVSRSLIPSNTIYLSQIPQSAAYDPVNNQLNITCLTTGPVLTTFAYDATNRTLQSGKTFTTPYGTRAQTLYDSQDKQIDITTLTYSVPNGYQTTAYAYDALSRALQTGKTFTTPGSQDGGAAAAYDSTNNQLDITGGAEPVPFTFTAVTNAYDAASRAVQTSETITTSGGIAGSFYDSTDRLLGVATASQSDGLITIYLYDAANRSLKASIVTPVTSIGPIVYDPAAGQIWVSSYYSPVLPEPACLSLIAAGGLALRRSRTRRPRNSRMG